MSERITSIAVKVQFDVLDDAGKVAGRKVTQDIWIYEADLGKVKDLMAYLKAGGLKFDEAKGTGNGS